MFVITLIKDKQIWEDFIKSCEEYTFLHSWSWGEFNLLMGNKVWRLGIFDGDELIGAALALGVKAKRGKFLFVPQGPILGNPKSEIRNPKQIAYSAEVASATKAGQNSNTKIQNILEYLIDYLKQLAEDEKCSFIRISPLVERNEENEKLFEGLGFRKAPMHMHMESTLLLDITKPEEELLKNMRKTTRYLVKQAEKRGVQLETEKPMTGKDFLRLQEDVVDRKHFIAFSEKQIKNEIEALEDKNPPQPSFYKGGSSELVIFNAKYNNKIIASALIIFYGYRAFYYQAASASAYRDVPAPHFLVWQAILAAKDRGCRIFDFYGASPDDQPKHPWAGPTLFKKGFGGSRIDYLEARDLVLNWRYWITWVVETVRRIKRGF